MPNKMLYTIGFTKKKAETFFEILKRAGIVKLIDIRLNNVSQLAGFTKRDDLVYFLQEICNCSYLHQPDFAPTKDILDAYKKNEIDWKEYVKRFTLLIKDRAIEEKVTSEELQDACLLCSEPTAEKCHRRLVAEYFKQKFPDIEIRHL